MSCRRPTAATLLLFALTGPAGCSSASGPASTADAGHSHDASHVDSSHPGDAKRGDAKVGDGKAPSDAGPPDASDAAPEIAVADAPPLLTLDCDPMVPTECGFPFPSNVWTIPDTTMPTGMHVYFGKTTLPMSKTNVRMSTAAYATRDGFAQGSTIMTHMPGATVTGLPTQNTIASSVTMTSATIVMEADTGALVPHFSEIDVRTTDPTTQAFMIQPSIRLKDATRYIVAIRHVVDAAGTALPANPVFAALRDGTPSTDLSVPPRRTLYADITSRLKAHGIDPTDLQLAWDFTTASQANTTQWLTTIRDAALTQVGAAGPSYTIDSVDINPDPYLAKRLHGTMTVPFYLTTTNVPASINFGPDGKPLQNGTATYPFLVHIPNSLVMSGKPGPILFNAHGLLGDQSEGEDSYFAEICNREGYVGVAVNLVGMDNNDIGFIGGVLGSDPTQFEQAIEMQHQGLVNELLAVRMMMGGLATDPATQPSGMPTIDPTQRFYRGDSQGGIFGSTFMAISTDVTRGMLGEPGGPYSLLLNRSADFASFFLFLNLTYSSELDIQFAVDLIDLLWFRTEPAGYASYVTQNMLEGTPAHNVLINTALGDHQVTPLGAEFIARSLGAQSLEPVNEEVYGITEAPSGFSGSGIVIWNFGLPTAPLTDSPPDAGSDPHDELRYVTAEQDMADQFCRTGKVNQTCPDGGPCKVVCGDAGLESCMAVSP